MKISLLSACKRQKRKKMFFSFLSLSLSVCLCLAFSSLVLAVKHFFLNQKKNFLNCHSCNSIKIEKNLMAPSLINNKTSDAKYNKQLKKFNRVRKTIYEYQKFSNVGNYSLTFGRPFQYVSRSKSNCI